MTGQQVNDAVYITKNNFDRVINNLDKTNAPRDYDKLYKSPLNHILSKPELNLLYVTMEAYKDFGEVFDGYTRIEKRPDTKRFAFEGASPSYHIDPVCALLTSDFVNLEIPPEIREKGDKSIELFRSFCRSNMDLLKSDESKFMVRLEAQFFLKTPPSDSIHFSNSGSVDLLNMDLEQVEERIDLLLFDADCFRKQDADTEKLIKHKGFGTHKAPEAKIPGHPLNIWHEKYKGDLKLSLQVYFRLKFNPELKFEGKLLDQLGFSACRKCSTN